MPAQKPTRFLSSAPELLHLLGKQCPGDHEHQPLTNGRPAAAAIYPFALCRAMLRGIEAQRRREGEPLLLSVLSSLDTASVQPEEEQLRVQDEQVCLVQHAAAYWDAITNEPLPAALTSAARQEELGFMNSWKVWDVVSVAECKQEAHRQSPTQGPVG